MRLSAWLGVGERRWKKAPDEEVQPAKTLWDWLQLLIVPAILIAVTFAWSATQTRSDNKREDRRIAADRAAAEEARQDATLRGYLGEMSGLMLDKNLLRSKESDPVRAVARTVTFTALRRLDGERKGAVVQFLREAELLSRPSSISGPGGGHTSLIWMSGADLRGTNLKDVFLQGVDLSEVDLTGANLAGFDLEEGFLSGSVLRRANLAGAQLGDTSLSTADLAGADLAGADLAGADLYSADLQGADLQGANLSFADIALADLRGANVKGADLTRANLKDSDPGIISGQGLTIGLDLDRYLAELPKPKQKAFLDSQKKFLDSLTRKELSKLNLSPEKLVRIRREASGG